MDRLTANFYPAYEPKRFESHPLLDEDGFMKLDEQGNALMSEAGAYVGKANITIANAIRINDISVFAYDSGKMTLNFPEYSSRNGEDRSYVIPKSADAYAAMVSVVEAARASEQGFAFTQGTYNPFLKVHGTLVDEPYADGRFSLEVGDVCTLHGLATRKAEYTVDGETHHFVAVDLPNSIDHATGKASTYEKDGHTRYNKVYEPLISTWTNQEGEKRSKDYGRVVNRLVLKERKQLREATREQSPEQEKTGLDQQLAQAKNRTGDPNTKQAPSKEMEMSM